MTCFPLVSQVEVNNRHHHECWLHEVCALLEHTPHACPSSAYWLLPATRVPRTSTTTEPSCLWLPASIAARPAGHPLVSGRPGRHRAAPVAQHAPAGWARDKSRRSHVAGARAVLK